MDIKTENAWLMFGDCLERMKEIPDSSVDMILCDLPYGTTSCKWDSIIPLDKIWKSYTRIITRKGAIVLTSAQPFTTILIGSNLSLFRYTLVWEKTRPSNQNMAKSQFLRVHEDICIFSKSSAHNMARERMAYYPQGLVYLGKEINQSSKVTNNLGENRTRNKYYFQEWTNYPKSVLKFNSEGKTVHPTQKPVTLMEYLIKTYTNEADTVLDNTMGSGTTGVACKNTNRKFIGIEMDPTYYGIACGRILAS